jgi:cell division protein FtsI/penicillin-binding protein 2
VFVTALCIVRTFYLTVIKHDYYQKAAFRSQLKQYQIPAERGVISAYSDGKVVPLVLNETLYTLYADPTFVKNPSDHAQKIQQAIGGDTSKYEQLLRTKDTKYVVLATKLSTEQQKKVTSLHLKGVGTRDASFRAYPDGKLAAQVLGFVNGEGEGKYGIEEALNKELQGTPGELKAITDAQGVPLPANKDNVITQPKPGTQVVLTIDVGLQEQVEDVLKRQVESTKAKAGSVVIMDPSSGAIKAMANYPTYDPSQFAKVTDGNLFNNSAVSEPIEVGSIMKPLTAVAALDKGVVQPTTSYFDPSFFKVDDATIKNVEEDGGAGTKDVQDILRLSLNTGATWLLMQMGGGEINKKARETWHDYMVNRFQFGKPTGIEQGFEAPGYIPDPNKGFGLDVTYANTSFGQGMLATPLQMSAAFSTAVNGGTYHQPHLVDKRIHADGREEMNNTAAQANLIKPTASKQLRDMLVHALYSNRGTYGASLVPTTYIIGGKTGTAQIADPKGGYYDDKFNGTYLGFVGGPSTDQAPQYVVAVQIIEPKVVGYAGAKAAAPTFLQVAQVLINNFDVVPKDR